MKTVLVMAGGTGGHIFPGLAVAEELHGKGWRIVWLGHPDGMEAQLIPRHGYEQAWMRFSALRGKGIMRKLALPLNLCRGLWQAYGVLRRIRPDVVLGMGGYVTFPAGLMAVMMRRPLVVHEQNALPGLANKTLARVAAKILSGFPGALPAAQWVGNPVRKEIAQLPDPSERYRARQGRLRLLVVGGSLGALKLNQTVPEALARIPVAQRPVVVHQSGQKNIDELKQCYQQHGVEATLLPFIEDMAHQLAEADIVISRAGALTVAELAAAGVAGVLVPYPHAVDDHQTANARFLVDTGGAVLMPQSELTAEGLARWLVNTDRERLMHMAQQARAQAKPQAAEDVAQICEALAAK